MIIKKYPAPPIETAAERYDRDWLNVPDLDTAGKDDYRRDRTLLRQPVERKSRRYVDDGVSAVTGGPPIYDPNLEVPVDPEEPSPNAGGWTETFSSSTAPAEWSIEGNVSFNPLTLSDPEDESGAYLSRLLESPFFEITISLKTLGQISIPMGNNIALYLAGVNAMRQHTFGSPGGLQDITPEYEVEEVKIRTTPNGMELFFNNALILSDTSIQMGQTFFVEMANVAGFTPEIYSIKFTPLNTNGGETPEPEGPVVPEGS